MDRYEKSGIHQIKCMDFPLKYKGEMDQIFYTRYKEPVAARS
jgi:hypothetical protein